MASVALCPRCSHDLLVPDSTDPDAWAQCSACNVLFQVRDAISRDVAELRLVEPVPEPVEAEYAKAPLELAHDELHLPKPTPTIDISSQKTLDDIGSLGGSDDLKLDVSVGDEDMPTTSPRRSAPTVDDLAKSSAPTWEDAPAEHVVQHAEVEPPIEADVDLASARTIAEIPDLPPYSPPATPAAPARRLNSVVIHLRKQTPNSSWKRRRNRLYRLSLWPRGTIRNTWNGCLTATTLPQMMRRRCRPLSTFKPAPTSPP